MKTLKVGIASYEAMKARTLAIAKGELRPKTGDPKVWFTSPESFAKLLSNRNRALLAQIADTHPSSHPCMSWRPVPVAPRATFRARSRRWSGMAWSACTRASVANCAPRSGIAMCTWK